MERASNPPGPPILNFRPPGRLRPPRRTCASTRRGFPRQPGRNGTALAGVTRTGCSVTVTLMARSCGGTVGDAPHVHQPGGQATGLPHGRSQSVRVEATNHHGEIDTDGRQRWWNEPTDQGPLREIHRCRGLPCNPPRELATEVGEGAGGAGIEAPPVALHNVDYGRLGWQRPQGGTGAAPRVNPVRNTR